MDKWEAINKLKISIAFSAPCFCLKRLPFQSILNQLPTKIIQIERNIKKNNVLSDHSFCWIFKQRHLWWANSALSHGKCFLITSPYSELKEAAEKRKSKNRQMDSNPGSPSGNLLLLKISKQQKLESTFFTRISSCTYVARLYEHGH